MGQTCCKSDENDTNTKLEENKVIEVGRSVATDNYLQNDIKVPEKPLEDSGHEPNDDIARLIPDDQMNKENNTVSEVIAKRGSYKFIENYEFPSDSS